MNHRLIKVGELEDFVKSKEYQSLQQIPITIHRAISQSKNPRADKDDPALLLAYDTNNNIISYVGFLPDYIDSNPQKKIFWNSGWWSDKKEGKKIALKLFYLSLIYANERALFSDMTPHTTRIINNTKIAVIPEAHKGIKAFLKFCFSDILPNKNKLFKYIIPALKIIDKTLNFFIFNKEININDNYIIEIINELSASDSQFIVNNSTKELCKRSTNELMWIKNNPWIINRSNDNSNIYKKYHFSSSDLVFKQEFIRITYKEKIIAILLINNRNRHFTIPYIYSINEETEFITKLIFNYLINNKAKTITTYNKNLHDAFFKYKKRFIHVRFIQKNFAYTKKTASLIPIKYSIQDGDGDCAFT